MSETFGAGEVAPCVGITRANWKLRRQQSTRESLSGDTDIIEAGVAYWEVDVSVELPDRTNYFDVWEAFMNRRRGADQTFLMSRTFRPKPLVSANPSYPTGAVSGWTAPSNVLSLLNFAGYEPNVGDMISYNTVGGGLWIGQVVQYNSGVSNPIDIQVEPATAEPAPGGGTPIVHDAVGEFALDGEPRFREGHKRRSLRFKARQVIR